MILGLGIDPILVTVTGSGTRFTTRVPLAAARAQSMNALATCIGLPVEAIRTDHHAPITGGLDTDFVLVELAVQPLSPRPGPAPILFGKPNVPAPIALQL